MTDQQNYLEHKTIDGDRWDLLAYRYYGDVKKQSLLINANKNLFLFPLKVPPLILSSGITLRIPIIAEAPDQPDTLPPWKSQQSNYGSGAL